MWIKLFKKEIERTSMESCNMKENECYNFYETAKNFVENSDYADEPKTQKMINFNQVSAEQFFIEFAFVIFNTGMKNQIAQKMFEKFRDAGNDPNTVNHELKKAALIRGLNENIIWFQELKRKTNDRDRVEYLQTLPFIGKITKYHLAKNIGIDCVKPDRHLILLGKKFEFDTPRMMCEFIASKSGDLLRVVDVILWRYCNLNPSVIKEMKQTVL